MKSSYYAVSVGIGLVVAGVGLSQINGCAAKERVLRWGLEAAEQYCRASPTSRQALREQVSTSKGPVIQVNCENLEGDGT